MTEEYWIPQLSFAASPEPVLIAQSCYEEAGHHLPNSNFLKGAKWSPEGSCLLTASEDNRLRVFDLPEDSMERAALGSGAELDSLRAQPDNVEPVIQAREAETIYDFAWFSAMRTDDPASCCFASTSRGQPVHLWDACSNELRCTYRAYDLVDEVTPAYSLAFSPDGSKLYGGFNKIFRVWDTSRPGRDYVEVSTHKKGTDGLSGIISCMDFNVDHSGLMAVGSYAGDAALYDSHTNALQCLLQGQKAGLTQVQYSPDGNFLFCGARTCPEIWCWDIRFTSGLVYKLERDTASTNQRMSFDIEPCGRHLATGGQDGTVKVFDLSLGTKVAEFRAADDTVNGFQFHPTLPFAVTCSGQRRYCSLLREASDQEEDLLCSEHEAGPTENLSSMKELVNTLLVWRFEHQWLAMQQTGSENPASES